MDTDTRKVSLVSIHVSNNFEHGGQTKVILLFTPKNKKNVGQCLMFAYDVFKEDPNCSTQNK